MAPVAVLHVPLLVEGDIDVLGVGFAAAAVDGNLPRRQFGLKLRFGQAPLDSRGLPQDCLKGLGRAHVCSFSWSMRFRDESRACSHASLRVWRLMECR